MTASSNMAPDEEAIFARCRAATLGIPPAIRRHMIAALRQGLETGRVDYGPLDLATDERDMRAEAGQECRDAMHYISGEIQRGGGPNEREALLLIARAWALLGGRV